jgi:dienelactone hydrolase
MDRGAFGCASFTTEGSNEKGSTALRAIATLCVLVLCASTSFAEALSDGYRVFRPDGAGPYPSVALVSGCSGFAPVGARKFYERVADELRGRGYVVLFVDYVGRRGLQHCARPPMVSEREAAHDLVMAVTWLRSQPFVDPARISALGWSYGGGAVLVALADNTDEQLGLARAIVYYPICRAVRPWRGATPVLMLLAGDDEVAPSRACQVAVEKSGTPSVVKTVTYHGALHAFDVSEIPEGTRGPGGAMGYNAQAASAAWKEVQDFLKIAQ